MNGLGREEQREMSGQGSQSVIGRSMVRIQSAGYEGWAEQIGPGQFLVTDGPLEGVRADNVIVKAPFYGTHVFGMAINFKCMVGDRENYETPIAFLKSPHSLVLPDQGFLRPREAADIWVEVELALVVGQSSRPGDDLEGDEAIFGFTTACDVTRRGDYGRDNHLAISKARPGFCPINPVVRKHPPEKASYMRTWINNRLFQDGRVADMIFDWRACYRYLADSFTLDEGDVILCGTPANSTNCLVQPGDYVRHEIEGFEPRAFKVH